MKAAPLLRVALRWAACSLPAATGVCADPNLPLDRPFTLRNAEPFLLEREYHRLLAGEGPRSYIFPRPCRSPLDATPVCPETAGWRHGDSARGQELRLGPMAGFEHRRDGEGVQAFEFGGVASGGHGPLSFRLDARMFTEVHEDALHASYDREFVERQDEDQSGSIAYTSYSRFRSDLSYDWSWGRLSAARDAAHWGPGQFHNLAFHQDAVPFNKLDFTSHLGPFTVQTLYGRLAPGTDWEMDTTSDFRSVYAHRYEWRATRDLVLGVSEQMILHKREAPFAFIPVIPLFIAKAGEKERLNNGNIAFDFSWRLPGLGAVYSEFLIDDIQSPTALFDDQWGNKWGWLAGLHHARALGGREAGFAAEYARVEPWVYTHYLPATAQTANFDHPLGNQLGPNSQAMTGKAYARAPGRWYLSLRTDLVWKGRDRGSSLLDIHDPATDGYTKEFLEGIGKPDVRVRPQAWLRWRGVTLHAEADLGKSPGFLAGIQYWLGPSQQPLIFKNR